MRKKIVILPVFNEEATVVDVLSRLIPQVDTIIIVDDGSTDTSKQRIIDWKRKITNPEFARNVHFFSLKRNSGKGRVFWNCFCFLKYLLDANQISPEDLIITIDADGQHKPENITSIIEYLEKKNLELVITKRDFSVYPFYKKFGNKFLSTWASIIGGFNFKDIESGFRVFQAKVINDILPYYTGYRYSCEQEFGIIATQLKIKMDNEYPVEVDTYVPGARFRDAFGVVLMGIIAFLRVKFKLVNKKFDWEMVSIQ
ncbi:MAG: glycosyltransferase family 2 protein [Nitrospirota bacterium]